MSNQENAQHHQSDPIGVMDSGIGGLTVVKTLQEILPNENILFYGDSANCPYGNRSEAVITNFTKGIINFLKSHNVKIISIACNTMSTLIDKIKDEYDFEIIGVVEPAAAYIAKIHPKDVGVIATVFTIKTKEYNELIERYQHCIKVIGQGSPDLAHLIECGEFNYEKIDAEIKKEIDIILAKDPAIKNIIFGCTHYPIIADRFKFLYPNINFINPAIYQAQAVKVALEANQLLNPSKKHGEFRIFTSGDTSNIDIIQKKLGLFAPCEIIQEKIQ